MARYRFPLGVDGTCDILFWLRALPFSSSLAPPRVHLHRLSPLLHAYYVCSILRSQLFYEHSLYM